MLHMQLAPRPLDEVRASPRSTAKSPTLVSKVPVGVCLTVCSMLATLCLQVNLVTCSRYFSGMERAGIGALRMCPLRFSVRAPGRNRC